MTLLYHTYEREPSGALHCPGSGQRLLVRSGADGRFACEYSDPEISHVIETDRLPGGLYGGTVLIDWNVHEAVLGAGYGTWRRLTWFMLDALAVWLAETGSSDRQILALGGWLGGEWRAEAMFTCGWAEQGGASDRLAEPVAPWRPFPIDAPAPLWRFEPGLEGAREGRIAVVETEGDAFPLADPESPVAEQLADVPRFVGDDGTILFFHRVVPHVGPEYAPAIDYGLVGRDHGFYFRENSGHLSGVPIRLREAIGHTQPAIREELPRWWANSFARGGQPPPDRFRLHPVLREQLYFAGTEANALFARRRYEELPNMGSLEFDQHRRFGTSLGKIAQPPLSVGLPHAWIGFTPLLIRASEEGPCRRPSQLEEYIERRDRPHRSRSCFR